MTAPTHANLCDVLLSHFPNGSVYLIDRERRVVLSGGQGIETIGLSHEAIRGKTLEEVLGQDESYELFRRAHENAIGGQEVRTEIELRDRVRQVHLLPVRESDNSIHLVMAMTQDVTERKKAEEALRHSQRLYSTLVENFPNGVVFMLDRDMRFLMLGGQGLPSWELPSEDVIGRHYLEVCGRSSASGEVTALFQAALGGMEQTGEVTVNGRVRSVQMVPVRCETGEVSLVLAITQDITDRKHAEQERQHSQESLQKANDELEQRVRERTAELEQLNRMLHGQIAERQMVMGALRETVSMLERAKAQAERANEELRANEALLLQGNHIFTGLTRLRVNSNAEMGAALQVLTESGCQLLDVARCSVWAFDDGHNSLRCLDHYQRATREHGGSITFKVSDYPAYFNALEVGKPIAAGDAQNHPVTHELCASYFAPFDIHSTLDVPIINNARMVGVLCFEHSGELREWKVDEQTVAASAAAVCALIFEWRARAEAREALHWAAQAAEIARTEAEIAREEAEDAREEAERANAAKSEFLSRMSHELRTPLNSILGFAQIMEMQLPPSAMDKQAQRVGYILKAGHHLLQLINEVLDIAHVESGRLSLSPESVSIDNAIHSTIELTQPLCALNALEMTHEPSESGQLFVRADRQRLSQVLLNLLSNATKYNRYGGRIWVRSQIVRPNWVRISVHDTGGGIAPEFAHRIFQPFERLGAENGTIEGTGLGLALSRRLVEAMDGQIGLESTVGEGSEFWVELPLDVDPLQKVEPLPATLHTFGDVTQQHTLLYIEDNLANLQVIEHLLDGQGQLKILSAMQGQIGLELARQHRPSLILLDLHLPDISGDEVLQRLHADPVTRDIPVVVISADATPHRLQLLKSHGADEYLTKPLDVRLFLEVLHNLLLKQERTH